MTPEEWAVAGAAAKEEYDRETRDLAAQLERARAKVARLEARLTAIHDQHRLKVAHLGAALLGLPPEELAPSAPESPPARRAVPERKRGALDEPVLALATELASPDVTSRQIQEAWNQRHPDDPPITESTVRSILERLDRKGHVYISQQGGGKGSGIPRKYRPKMQ
jgi:hypothetical protein